ncbi:MAG: MerR family transcriptional regulator [Spirochaetales bacterium]|nr:MerR family transcriptional regulator [Spirochaetales bacterium]
MERKEYSIGQFSVITRLTVKAIRFYHEKGVLTPARVDDATGYRYYDAASIERARIVATLRRLEFSVEEIANIVRECREDEDAAVFLRRKAEEIQRKIRHLRRLERDLTQILASVETEYTGGIIMNVERKSIPATLAVTIRYTGRYDEIGPRIGLLFRLCGRWGAGRPFGLHWNSEYRETDADVEACLELKSGSEDAAVRSVERFLKGPLTTPVEGGRGGTTSGGDRIAVRTIPPADVLALEHIGGYDTLSPSYRAILDEIVKQGLTSTVPSREVYIKGPGMIFRGNPARYRTEIRMPIARAREDAEGNAPP